jgi:acyl carrier protein
MSFFKRIREIAQTEGWLKEQGDLWAARFYPGDQSRVAAITVSILVENVGVGFERMEPSTRFIEDLGMDELEPVEFVMALEEEFGFKISDEDAARLGTLGALISYLHERVRTHAG